MDKIKFDYHLSKIEELLNNNKYYDAIDLCKEVVDDSNSVKKHSFNNGIEYYLYLTTFDSNIEKESLNYRKFYNLYGTCLMLTGKYIEARSYFKKSLEIDPFDSLIRFKYTDTFRLTNELDDFFKESNFAINYCYKASDFQRFYRNISEYYFRYENYVESLYMIMFARYVSDENSEITTPELFRIYDCLGKKLDPSIDAIMNFMENKNINIPTNQITKLNYIYTKIKDYDAVTALEILQILYDLTNDESYKEILVKINLR
ncbi:MAG: tetratricopeptide repeat protein [bacterium]|nr:tetratricopeptide repeat protein [bacterium]